MSETTTAPIEAEDDCVLELTTTLAEAKTFKVDGERFKLLGLAHLSPDEEATVMATIARLGRIEFDLENTNDDKEAKTLAVRLREKRIKLLSTLTTLTDEQAGGLPLPEQGKLVKTIQREAGIGVDDDGSGSDPS